MKNSNNAPHIYRVDIIVAATIYMVNYAIWDSDEDPNVSSNAGHFNVVLDSPGHKQQSDNLSIQQTNQDHGTHVANADVRNRFIEKTKL